MIINDLLIFYDLFKLAFVFVIYSIGAMHHQIPFAAGLHIHLRYRVCKAVRSPPIFICSGSVHTFQTFSTGAFSNCETMSSQSNVVVFSFSMLRVESYELLMKNQKTNDSTHPPQSPLIRRKAAELIELLIFIQHTKYNIQHYSKNSLILYFFSGFLLSKRTNIM